MILATVQGIYLQIEGMKHCSGDSVGTIYIVIDHLLEVITFFLMFVRHNEENEEQRMLLIMIVLLNILYSVHLVDKYREDKNLCYDLKR